MTDKLQKTRERFPFAQVPGALTADDVFKAWRERGFEPQEMSDSDILQTIKIINDPVRGTMQWSASKNLDGLGIIANTLKAVLSMQAIITAECAQSVCEYFTKGEGRIDLGTGEAMVLIVFKNGRLALDWNPKDAPIAAKKLLASALLYMIAEDAGLPLENLLNAFGWKH